MAAEASRRAGRRPVSAQRIGRAGQQRDLAERQPDDAPATTSLAWWMRTYARLMRDDAARCRTTAAPTRRPPTTVSSVAAKNADEAWPLGKLLTCDGVRTGIARVAGRRWAGVRRNRRLMPWLTIRLSAPMSADEQQRLADVARRTRQAVGRAR